ncbi:hypothetical protein F5984_07760 [Rudanella paleaurantiibacter]|uniref:Uncharacterized protein n=1 Tax=Rudanella paleaurantiibacter TaxID=2614655 RepID=A0A7J5U391_9BACT|nr:hypothetical protein [Rudanella paleaurantiibacter]KAB7732098.1 hypothetical protein F5984_07760 [Rudanella paleaurantiibacter]
MQKLSTAQIKQLHDHLIRQGASDALLYELLDHLICEVEHYMWIGLPFEAALDKVLLEASHTAVHYLNQTYQTAMDADAMRGATLDDIVFEFRNKYYGAYDLRQSYRLSLLNALLLGIGAFLMLVVWVAAFNQRSFSYLSPLGLLWLVGVSCVGVAVGSWFLHNLRQRYMEIS